MKKKAPTTIRIAAAIFIIFGILQLFAFAAFFSGPMITLGSGSGDYRPLPGATEYVSQSVPVNIYYILALVTLAFAFLGIFEGIFLLNLESYSYPLGIILSIVMLFSIPLGTVLGVLALFILYDSRSLIKKK